MYTFYSTDALLGVFVLLSAVFESIKIYTILQNNLALTVHFLYWVKVAFVNLGQDTSSPPRKKSIKT